jgi:hypothetical protein
MAWMSILIYHITHLHNLSSILKAGGLWANSQMQQERLNFQDISYERIQDRRARIRVPCGAGGVLHDYVPFYFAPRSPMLYAIHKRNVTSCPEGQAPIIYLVSDINAVEAAEIPFAFTDGHAAMAYSDFYDELLELQIAIDWDIMGEVFWHDTDQDGDRKRRRQAEFLIHRFCPWSLITEIGVINATVQKRVCQILQNMKVSTPVTVYNGWYY